MKIEAKSYTLRNDNGQWLGQVVLTSDGMFSAVTDYGNMSYAWRGFGNDFRDFLISLNIEYFGDKMYQGMSYMAYGRKYEKACDKFAEKILPVLQKALKKEIQAETKQIVS